MSNPTQQQKMFALRLSGQPPFNQILVSASNDITSKVKFKLVGTQTVNQSVKVKQHNLERAGADADQKTPSMYLNHSIEFVTSRKYKILKSANLFLKVQSHWFSSRSFT